MSYAIDSKIVEMRFDNREFESGVSDTISSIEKLNSSLQFKGSTKGFEDIGAASKQTAESIDDFELASYKAGFRWSDVLHKISSVAEWQMARHAVDMLSGSLKNVADQLLGVTSAKAGFDEYGLKMGSIQTIMASTGESLETVNGYLDELNAYSDKTIYSFSDMTQNIGKFTNAGVSLKDSVAAIQGVANVAALSGANSNEASRAMYNFSQALSAGYVKLIDWKSIENANMATVGFKEELIKTGLAMGTITEAGDGMYKTMSGNTFSATKNFNEVLQDQWMTSDVLTKTLANYSDETTEIGAKATKAATEVKTFGQMMDTLKESAQSGWAQTWELVFGDFEEGKALWTYLSETIGGFVESTSKARNELLDSWKVLGGRDSLFEMYDEAGNRIDALANIIEALKSVITPIKDAFSEIFPPFTAERLFALTEGFRKFTANLKLSDSAAGKLKRIFKGLFAVVDIVAQAFGALFKGVTTLLGETDGLAGGLLGVIAVFGDWLVNLRDFIKENEVFNKVISGIASVLSPIIKMVKSFIGIIGRHIVFPGLEGLQAIFGFIGDKMLGIGEKAEEMRSGVSSAFDEMSSAIENCGFVKFLQTIWNAITKIASTIVKTIGSLAGGLFDTIGSGGFGGFIDLMNTIIVGGVGVGFVKFLKAIPEAIGELTSPLEYIKDIAGKITGILDGVRGCFEAWQTSLKADALMKIASAIAILTAALVILSLIEGEKLASSIGAITALFIELMTAMAVLSKIDPGAGTLKLSFMMGKLATALLVLSVAMKIMSTMSPGEMAVGLIGIAGALAVMVAAVKLLPEKNVKAAASAIGKLSTALLILAVAIKIMSTMSWSEMAVGLVTMTAGLAVLVGAVQLLPTDTSKRAAGLVGLATAMVILAAALKIMATMSWEDVAVSLVALAGSMAILAVGLNYMKSALPGAAAIFIVAPALVLLAAALKIMSTMSWEDVAVSLVALAGALGILAVGLTLMSGAILGAAAIFVVAPALILLATALNIMGSLSWQEVGVIMATLASALGILAVGLTLMLGALPGAAAMLVVAAALAILTPVLLALGMASWETIGKGLLALAGIFTVMGVAGLLLTPLVPTLIALSAAIVLLGVGCLAAGTGIAMLAAGVSVLVAMGSSAVSVLTSVIVTLINLIPVIATKIGEGFIAILNVIADSSPAIGGAIKALILALCDALTQCVPELLACAGVLLEALLEFIVSYVPKIVDAGIKLIIGLLEGIASNIGDVISTAVDVILAFIEGVASQIPKVIQAGLDLMFEFINGLADGIRTNTQKTISAVNNLMSAVFEAIGMYIGNIPELGRQLIQGFINGITASAGDLWNTIVGVVEDAWNGVLSFLGINSPSRLAAEAGRFVDEGLAVGLEKYSHVAGDAAVGVGEATMDSLSSAISKASDAVANDIDAQPTIRPVLDLSGVKNGAKGISDIFGSDAMVGVSANVGAINSMMNRRSQNGGNSDVVSAIDDLRKDLSNVGGTSYNINGITYDDGSNVAEAIRTIVQAARVERRA